MMLRRLYGVPELPDVVLFSSYEDFKKLLSFVVESAKLLRDRIWGSDQDSINDMNVSEDRVGIGRKVFTIYLFDWSHTTQGFLCQAGLVIMDYYYYYYYYHSSDLLPDYGLQ
eukprot:TRINITY_DN8366_c1_g3_i2.p2 TRINITY_DN8366_c1_g3~~TRINITY_DN8366_c1_g3_i2.p2  ORF type:complete len:112 (-),score=9.93 TRINITY_DN8366_c1_g3_i2:25-360(-)